MAIQKINHSHFEYEGSRAMRLLLLRLTSGLTALLSVFALVACGSGGGGGAVPQPIGGGLMPSCLGCPAGTGTFLDSAVGQVISYSLNQTEAELSLEFFGADVSIMNPMLGGYLATGNNSYQGAVAAQGIFVVQIPSALCNLPAGIYEVTTSQPGMWGGGGQSFGNLVLNGYGPTQIQIAFGNWGGMVSRAIPPAVSFDGRQFPFRLQGMINVRGPNAMSWCPMTLQ
jgi:hypothetical protein